MNLINLFTIGAIIHLSILAHHLAKHTMTCPNCNQPDQPTPNQKILWGTLRKRVAESRKLVNPADTLNTDS